MKEFAVIENFFRTGSYQRKDVLLGIGDDCAITKVPKGQRLAVTTDTLVSGVHFLPDAPPRAIAHKAVAVNLSDLAAMGAEPAWLSLSLSVPHIDESWLAEFSAGIHELSNYYSVQLIGGDTVRGPLSLTITAQGFVPEEQALTRSNARPGDWVYVTGTLGDAGLGLDLLFNKQKAVSHDREYLLQRLYYPTPRLLAGTALRRIANACIDISDGLIADLQHVLNASKCGATVHLEKLPLSDALRTSVDFEKALHYALFAGDDYELLFSVSEENKGLLEKALSNFNVAATCIGQLNGQAGKITTKLNNAPYPLSGEGFEHFSDAS